MKFACKTSELLQALNLVGRAISTQQALPILGNVLIEVEGKRCKVSATDLELSIVTSFEADIENEGSITVPVRAILNFAQYNSDSDVLLETSEGTQLKCTSKHAKTLIAGEAASEYPTITPIKKDTSFSIEAGPLLEALHMVTFASARSTLRPVLSGVYIRVEKGNLVLVATDSYRLTEYAIGAKVDGDDISCIVPVKVLEELRAALGAPRKGEKREKEEDEGGEKKQKKEQAKASVDVALSSQQIELRVGPTQLLSRLIEGKFPDYKQIIPKEKKLSVLLSSKELTTVVKRMHYFAKEINNNLTFDIKKGGVNITTPQTQYGKDEAILEADVTGGATKIALSSSYLLDFLNHVESDSVVMELTDAMHPAVFRTSSSDPFIHLIMPLRIQEE